MKAITLIFPHQLFLPHPALSNDRSTYILEEPHFFTRFQFHKQKLVLHRASLQYFYEKLSKSTKHVHYVPLKTLDNPEAWIEKIKPTEIHMARLYDHELEKHWLKLCKNEKIKIVFYDSEYFITDYQTLCDYFKKKPPFRLYHFYQAQRKRFNILMTKQRTPLGGAWSLDSENQKPLDSSIKIPPVKAPRTNSYVKEATEWTLKHFKNNPGEVDTFQYPITHKTAEGWLKDFLVQRLHNFGPYQDAIDSDSSILFHSLLSPLINIGLLTPRYVIDQALQHAQKHSIPLNSLEGFIRQIIGWREFVAGIYLQHGTKEQSLNFFKYTRKIPYSFWTGTTTIQPIDSTIKKILTTAYAHHIERLMILGNFMLLCEFKPDDAYKWFMELFIDAYDWVMIPNVYGMSQFADGGWFATKPYISSSNYIRKMSNFKKGEWCAIWDGLYWNFIYKNYHFFAKQPRLSMMINMIKRMSKATLNDHINHAQSFLKSLKN